MKTMPIIIVLLMMSGLIKNINAQQSDIAGPSDTLVVIWSTGDIEVAEKNFLMYAHAAKRNHWFNEVIIVIWGPSAKLIAENTVLKEKIAAMKKDGVIIEACISCSNMYGVTDDLKACAIDVKGMGGPLTKYLKRGYKILSY
jgi:hypothetical protein